jgi:hypothetical protein
MSLTYHQQWQLRLIGRALGQSDPDVAAMLTLFIRTGWLVCRRACSAR